MNITRKEFMEFLATLEPEHLFFCEYKRCMFAQFFQNSGYPDAEVDVSRYWLFGMNNQSEPSGKMPEWTMWLQATIWAKTSSVSVREVTQYMKELEGMK